MDGYEATRLIKSKKMGQRNASYSDNCKRLIW